MPLYDDDTRLHICGQYQLKELQDIPFSVVRLGIDNCQVPGLRLPQLPAHIKALSLYKVRVEAPLCLTEGLEQLKLQMVSSEAPLTEWTFPDSLVHLTARSWIGDVLDLRTVTAPAITLIGRQKHQLLLPQQLDELTINGGHRRSTVIVAFPATAADAELYEDDDLEVIMLSALLRTLHLVNVEGVDSEGNLQTTEIEHVTVSRCRGEIDFVKLFPRLETLRLDGFRPTVFSSLRLERLIALTLEYCTSPTEVVIDAPALEQLTVSNVGINDNEVRVSSESTLGETLTSLSLKRVKVFPLDQDWQRLEKLALAEVTFPLPFVQWLQELDLDQPLMANGVPVETIDEYKRAWGFRSKAKRPSLVESD